MIHITRRSTNVKLGPIVATRTKSETCPPSCGLFSSGECYDLQGHLRAHRKNVDTEKWKLLNHDEFIREMGNFTRVWRWAVGGDLPSYRGNPERIDPDFLVRMVTRAEELHQRPIIFTHKPVYAGIRGANRLDAAHNRKAIRAAQTAAPTIAVNISCESQAELDKVLAMGFLGVIVAPENQQRIQKTKAGNVMNICPAVTVEHVQCSNCGNGHPICANASRKISTSFPAHGAKKGALSHRILKMGLS